MQPANVSFIHGASPESLARQSEVDGASFEYGGGNGGGGDMLERIKKLEDQVASLVIDVAVIRSNYATAADAASIKIEVANAKSDLHSAMRLQALAIIGSVLAAVGTGVGIILKMMPSLPH